MHKYVILNTNILIILLYGNIVSLLKCNHLVHLHELKMFERVHISENVRELIGKYQYMHKWIQ